MLLIGARGQERDTDRSHRVTGVVVNRSRQALQSFRAFLVVKGVSALGGSGPGLP